MSRAALGWLCRLQRPQQHCVQRQRAAQGVALRSRCGCEYACRPRTRRCFFALAEQHNNLGCTRPRDSRSPGWNAPRVGRHDSIARVRVAAYQN